MDYEKAYKEALGRANAKIETYNHLGNASAVKSICEIFPELKESEDKRIRKEIIEYLEQSQFGEEHYQIDDDIVRGYIAWLEKQGNNNYLTKDDTDNEENTWNNAHDSRPKHLQRCLCYDKYMGGVYCYVYDDISKYWCTQTTEVHDTDGDNHICDYTDYRVTMWMLIPSTSSYSPKKQDEKIRKSLIKSYTNQHSANFPTVDGFTREQILAWLEKRDEQKPIISDDAIREGIARFGITQYQIDNWLKKYVDAEKQGEQKSIDKVEPKFRAGDFITDGERIFQIKETIWERNNRNDGSTYCESLIVNLRDGITYANNTDLKEYHLWTIQDAKDGDILEFADHGRLVIGIVSYVNKTGKVDANCLLEGNNFKLGNYYALDTIKPHPATKEQRDLLFQKMHEAGYEWDAENKKLMTIEQPAWSEEDEKEVAILEAYIRSEDWSDRHIDRALGIVDELVKKLKSVKEMVQPQPKQEWSEENESHIGRILSYLESFKAYNAPHIEPIKKEIDWLKSVREVYTWKPSDEQITALRWVLNRIPYDSHKEEISGLLEHLKHLFGIKDKEEQQ